eukprot:1063066-Pelagomonas_calceolata.AAC.7
MKASGTGKEDATSTQEGDGCASRRHDSFLALAEKGTFALLEAAWTLGLVAISYGYSSAMTHTHAHAHTHLQATGPQAPQRTARMCQIALSEPTLGRLYPGHHQ